MDAQTEALLARLGALVKAGWSPKDAADAIAKIRSLYAQLDARATVDAQRESYISDLQEQLAHANKLADTEMHKAQIAEAKLAEVERERDKKQAEIDRLMLEFCPGEMTQEQVEEWSKHQHALAKGE